MVESDLGIIMSVNKGYQEIPEYVVPGTTSRGVVVRYQVRLIWIFLSFYFQFQIRNVRRTRYRTVVSKTSDYQVRAYTGTFSDAGGGLPVQLFFTTD